MITSTPRSGHIVLYHRNIMKIITIWDMVADIVEEHRGLGGNIISRLDNGAFAGLFYSLLVLTD